MSNLDMIINEDSLFIKHSGNIFKNGFLRSKHYSGRLNWCYVIGLSISNVTDDLVEITCKERLVVLSDGHVHQNNGESSNKKELKKKDTILKSKIAVESMCPKSVSSRWSF